MKLSAKHIYQGTSCSRSAFVIGDEFGPCILATNCSLEDAIDEWDERHGKRVDFDLDRECIRDYTEYDDSPNEEFPGFFGAMNCGDIRINDGGTIIWVNHYEWFREFPTVKEAGKFFENRD